MNWFERAREHLAKWKAARAAASNELAENYTPRAQQAIAHARKEADRLNHDFLGTEHLLLGIIKLGQGVAVNVLQQLGAYP